MRSVRSASTRVSSAGLKSRELAITADHVPELHAHRAASPDNSIHRSCTAGPTAAVVEIDEMRPAGRSTGCCPHGNRHAGGCCRTVPARAITVHRRAERVVGRCRDTRQPDPAGTKPCASTNSARRLAEAFDVDARPMRKRPRSADRMDAPEEPPDPAQGVRVVEFRRAPALPRKQRETEAADARAMCRRQQSASGATTGISRAASSSAKGMLFQ